MGTRGVPPPVLSLETDEMGMDPPQSGFEPDYLHMFDIFFDTENKFWNSRNSFRKFNPRKTGVNYLKKL